jgi:hypothetical protein
MSQIRERANRTLNTDGISRYKEGIRVTEWELAWLRERPVYRISSLV